MQMQLNKMQIDFNAANDNDNYLPSFRYVIFRKLPLFVLSMFALVMGLAIR